MTMERKIFGLVAGLLLTIGTNAQATRTKATPEDQARQRTEHMTKDLGLTAEQAEKVHALNLEEAQEMAAFREDRQVAKAEGQARQAEVREQFRTRHEQRKEALKAILTPEQLTRYEAMHTARPTRKAEGKAAPAK